MASESEALASLAANIEGCQDCGRVVGEKHHATCPVNLRLQEEARKRSGGTEAPPVVLGNRGYETDAAGRAIKPKRETMTFSLDGIEVEAVAEWEWEYDDDGCGGPGTTGNSMTGYRGRYKSVTGLRFAGTAEEALKILNDALESCVDEAQDKIWE